MRGKVNEGTAEHNLRIVNWFQLIATGDNLQICPFKNIQNGFDVWQSLLLQEVLYAFLAG